MLVRADLSLSVTYHISPRHNKEREKKESCHNAAPQLCPQGPESIRESRSGPLERPGCWELGLRFGPGSCSIGPMPHRWPSDPAWPLLGKVRRSRCLPAGLRCAWKKAASHIASPCLGLKHSHLCNWMRLVHQDVVVRRSTWGLIQGHPFKGGQSTAASPSDETSGCPIAFPPSLLQRTSH